MSTFTGYAIQEASCLITKCNDLLTEIRDGKGAVMDPASLQILTNLQASMLCLRSMAGDLKANLEAAQRNREPTGELDGKSRAAGETDEDPAQLTF